MVSNGAKTNILNSLGYSPFYVALKNNNLAAAYLLFVEGNANINIPIDKEMNTPLHESVKMGNVATVTFLVTQCGADLLKPNGKGEIPFFLALQYPRLINQILKTLSPTSLKDSKKIIPSINDMAGKRASFDAVEYMNAVVRYKSKEEGQNALHKCASAGYIHSLGELLTHLSEQNVKEMTSERDRNGNTPLHLSVINNFAEICFSLTQLKPTDCLLQNNDGDTPMHIALKHAAYKCARVLYNNSKAFTKENNKGETIQALMQMFKQELKSEDDISKQLLEVDLSKAENYRFHKLMTDHTFVSKMKDYLSLNKNQDMMIFYETVQEFKMTNSNSERYHMAEQIVDHFLAENSPHKLKFMKNAFGPFKVKFTECSSDHCPKDLFINLETLALKSLKDDSFSKFIKSKLFTKYLERKKQTDPTFLVRFVKSSLSDKNSDNTSENGSTTKGAVTSNSNTGSASEKNTNTSDSDEIIEIEDENDVKEHVKFCPKCGTELLDLDNWVYTDKDFKKVLDNLLDMNQWKVLHESESGRTYVSPPELHNHLSNSRRHTQIKYIGEMDCSSHSLFNMWIDPDYLQSRDSRLESCKQIDFIRSGKYATVVHHEILKMKFPQQNRDFVHAFCCKFDEEEQRYMCISRSVNHPKAPVTSKVVRGEVKTAFMVERINDQKCRYYYAVTADFGGWLNEDFYLKALKSESEFIHSMLIKLVKQRDQLGKKRPEKGGLIQSLDYYLSKKE